MLRRRLFAAYDHTHIARLDRKLYDQRWMAEAAFGLSSLDSTSLFCSREWYREFREPMLTAAVYNLVQTLKQLP